MTTIHNVLANIDARRIKQEADKAAYEAHVEARVERMMNGADLLSAVALKLEIVLNRIEGVLEPVHDGLDAGGEVVLEGVDQTIAEIDASFRENEALIAVLDTLVSEDELNALIDDTMLEGCGEGCTCALAA